MDTDRVVAVARLAALDGGVLSRRRLLSVGISGREVTALRRSGVLTNLRRGWYRVDGADDRVVATVRAGAVLTCISALAYRPGVWIPPGIERSHVRWSEHRSRPHFAAACRASVPLATPTLRPERSIRFRSQ